MMRFTFWVIWVAAGPVKRMKPRGEGSADSAAGVMQAIAIVADGVDFRRPIGSNDGRPLPGVN